jgi:hypothetical protein
MEKQCMLVDARLSSAAMSVFELWRETVLLLAFAPFSVLGSKIKR